jgi:hypothetical protein
MPTDIEILFIGEESYPEFAPIAAWLADRNAAMVKTTKEGLARIHTGFAPTIVVVAQPWPGHVTTKQIESLREAAPLARIVSLLGTWLEGEARTGKPWPAVWRIYWHTWLPRFAAQLDRLAAGEQTLWALPSTAGDDERILYLGMFGPRQQDRITRKKTIAIVSATRDAVESLSDICRQCDWETIWLKSPADELPPKTDLVLFDCRHLGASEFAKISNLKAQLAKAKSQISNFKSQVAQVPILVLVGFPRLADIEYLQSLGVAAIVSKPFLTRDLVWQIEQIMDDSLLAV